MARSTVWLFGFLLIALGGGIGYGVGVLSTPVPVVTVPSPPNPTALPPELELRYQLLKNQLDNAAENSKQLDRLLTLLVALTSLYALALGLNSFFGLKQILESGKEDLSRLREFLVQSRTETEKKLREVDDRVGATITNAHSQLAEFRTELREKYPELANLHASLRDLLSGIRLIFRAGQNWTTQYGELACEQRERFRVAEMRVSGLEVFQPGEVVSFRDDMRRVYQGLARFYSSKYQEEKDRSDWERASLYFQAAVQLDPTKPTAELMKDVGVHLTQIEVTLDDRVAVRGKPLTPQEKREVGMLRSRAEQSFSESLSHNPLEPGALFGLGWVHQKNENYQAAIAQYAVLTGLTAWSVGERQKYLEDAFVNEAECYSLLASSDPADNNYTTAMTQLAESKKIAAEFNRLAEWKKKIEQERTDLGKLKTARAKEFADLLA